jgi:RNA polymerase sigma factor (TIGR02999 family)
VESSPDPVSELLSRARKGDADALERLLPIVYDELRSLAHSVRARSGGAETLNTTALVHEAYEKLARGAAHWEDRSHFFRVAAKAMRQVIINYATARQAAKRGGTHSPIALDAERLVPPERAGPLLALDEALTRLGVLDARQAQIVELRYFVGLTIPETAEVLGLSPATVKRDWSTARAWLHDAIGGTS